MGGNILKNMKKIKQNCESEESKYFVTKVRYSM